MTGASPCRFVTTYCDMSFVQVSRKDGFSIFHLGGCGKIMGGCILFPDNGLARRRFATPHSREFFPDIGLLARRNFAHTIQDLLLLPLFVT